MNVLITGAAGGIGRECVLRLSERRDCKIIAVSRTTNALQSIQNECRELNGTEIDIFTSDFRKESFHIELASHLKDKYGVLDCLINNAGQLVNRPFLEMTDGEIHDQFQVNFFAPLKLTRSLIPLLKKSVERPHVVNIGSMGGFMGSDKFPGLSAYSASKGALATLTECLAVEFKDSGIAFNCLALGSSNTEMLRKAFPGYESPVSPGDMSEYIIDFAINGQRYFNGKVIPVAGVQR